MKYRNEVTQIPESPMIRIAAAAERLEHSWKLQYGESDIPTPKFICDAAYEATLNGHTFYTHTAGCNALREQIAQKTFELHGAEYRPSEVVSTIGASMGITLAIRSTVGPGDNAIVIQPAYAIFESLIRVFGGEVRTVSLVPDGDRFALDLDQIRAAIDERTRLVVVNSPANPTGWMIRDDEQQALWQLAVERDFVILSDEVYERLTFDRPVARSFAAIATDRDHLIVVNSLSKTYNMTGWRLGWAMGSERVVHLMSTVAEFMTSNTPAMVQQAAIVALRDGEPYLKELRDIYARRRAMVLDELAGIPGVHVPRPEGAFYVFPKIEGLTNSADFAEDLLRATGVALAPGSAFGPAGEGHLRICFAGSETLLAEALGRLKGYLVERVG